MLLHIITYLISGTLSLMCLSPTIHYQPEKDTSPPFTSPISFLSSLILNFFRWMLAGIEPGTGDRPGTEKGSGTGLNI